MINNIHSTIIIIGLMHYSYKISVCNRLCPHACFSLLSLGLSIKDLQYICVPVIADRNGFKKLSCKCCFSLHIKVYNNVHQSNHGDH